MAQELPSTVSLFDYLYIDHVRVSSFLSQLSDYGHLSSVSVTDATNHDVASKIEAGAHLVGEIKFALEGSRGAQSSGTKTYDTLWINARSVLDVLDGIKLIERNLSSAEPGDIVLAHGELSISDLRVMRQLWGSILNVFGDQVELPDMSNMSRPERRRAQRKESRSGNAGKDESQKRQAFLEMIGQFMQEMPHAVQAYLMGDAGKVWFTMDPTRMSKSPEELALEHGEVIPGDWYVVGVVDALPGAPPGPGDAPTGASQVTRVAIEQVREQFGRQSDYYGITPLMVFRNLRTNKG